MCLELDDQLRGLPAEPVARALSAMVDRGGLPADLARQALGPEASVERVSRLARCIETAAELGPAAIVSLARALERGPMPGLDRRALTAVAPLAVRFARLVEAGERACVAALLSRLVDVEEESPKILDGVQGSISAGERMWCFANSLA